jgi:sterol desaturase/sphingolipid hydroxylase (fatty acid hydroxylase superfamily)
VLAYRDSLFGVTPTPRARPCGDRRDRARQGTHRKAWWGAIGVTAAAVWLTIQGGSALLHSGQPGHILAVAQLRTVGPALPAVVAVLFGCERLWPAVPRAAWSRAHVVDAVYLALFAAIAPLVTLLDTGFAVEVHRHASYLVLGRLPLGPQVVVVGLVLVGIDAINWVAHVADHRSAALWRFHARHHSPEEISVFTTFRTHPLAHASYIPALLPSLMLAASGAIPAAAVVVYGCLVTLPHANLDWTYGSLGKVLVSPAYHRLHHARGPVRGKQVVNFGFVMTCWDRLAGLAADPVGAPAETGIRGRVVPVEQAGAKRDLPQVVVAQLVQPFRVTESMGSRHE